MKFLFALHKKLNIFVNLLQNILNSPLLKKDIVWKYSGIRPLFEDKSDNTTEFQGLFLYPQCSTWSNASIERIWWKAYNS